ncbi:hypothetical protein L7F22_008157 [Adiantum nelumboides]|nr:hypothetical protein [Adiantum nelumboides]
MEESTTGKKKELVKGKQKGPAYKLQSDIELATNLKKVIEERILNSKVEFTLREVLGIAKHEFHEEIIDIIKRKRQTLGKAICPQAEEDDEEYQGIPRSLYIRTHWARATTETLVKIGDLEEPIVAYHLILGQPYIVGV